MDQNFSPSKYWELRSIFKYHIESYNALYQLKTENKEELNSIYKMIKTNLIDSKIFLPTKIIEEILNIIPNNNRYSKSYLELAKHIYDDFHVNEVGETVKSSILLFHQEYGIKLDNRLNYEEEYEDLDCHTATTIFKTIMYDDIKTFASFTESEGFNQYEKSPNILYPDFRGYSLLELCCYHGAVDCFKLLRTKFNTRITQTCLHLSFLGGNPEIMSECLKYQKPNEECMEYAILSHNIDFVTFLMNEYNIKINLTYCGVHNNLDAFFVYFDQTNDNNECFIFSTLFQLPSLCQYFLSHSADVNAKNKHGDTALHIAAYKGYKVIMKFLLLYGANIDAKNVDGNTAVLSHSKETVELLLFNGANVNEKNNDGETALHKAAAVNMKETVEILLVHGANINEKDNFGQTSLHIAVSSNMEGMVKLLLSHNANINEKNNDGETALHKAVRSFYMESIKLLLLHAININKKNKDGETALQIATKK
ncbi:hypothetical protein TVAG_109740 [Trichomonas vaginalis G3]|uniref:DUF3447 domain-containing protein n=1 Tax=Trichomonas vaginalis (strain ATCC PRA-98 / G3) TaxID=412133 RepID=A2EAG3_TRIV3|nr:hypothetical protein TVAG_109740 [Trichomonas vaginalis G3]|eukprot:XP_001322613.1 hypothetical protein [Trichomonas vaginalis G3]